MELVYALVFAIAGFLVVLIARVYVAKSDGHPIKFAERAKRSAGLTSGGWRVIGWVLAIALVGRIGYWMFAMPLADWYNTPSAPRISRPTSVPAPAAPYRKPMSGTLSPEIQAAPRDGKSLELPMAPNGTSAHVEVPGGCTPSFSGKRGTFTSHCKYADGSIGTIDDNQNTIVAGPMLYAFARNKTGGENTVTYQPVCR